MHAIIVSTTSSLYVGYVRLLQHVFKVWWFIWNVVVFLFYCYGVRRLFQFIHNLQGRQSLLKGGGGGRLKGIKEVEFFKIFKR